MNGKHGEAVDYGGDSNEIRWYVPTEDLDTHLFMLACLLPHRCPQS
jgi:hypothetical protein